MTDAAAITDLLGRWRAGDRDALADLMARLAPELRQLAERQLRDERPDHTLRATALVNEAYIRLVRADIDWKDRVHFFAVAATTMRRVLVDYARARSSARRGGGARPITLQDDDGAAFHDRADILDLDAALEDLGEHDARKVRVIELHYFGGLTQPEIAEVIGVSPATVDRDLRFSRAWLRERLER